MYGEFDLHGVFIPAILVLMALAYAVQSGVRWALLRLDAYRYVWHPPLFNLALYILVLGGLYVLMRKVQG
jgi:hypothetical protein